MTRRTLTLGLVATGIQAVRCPALQAISAVETATYGTRMAVMDSRQMPTREMVISTDGQPVWRVCGLGMCIETGSGIRAQAELEALCVAMGLEPPSGAPHCGPSEVDEPGV